MSNAQANIVRVLSNEPGKWEVQGELRELLALVQTPEDQFTLFISTSHVNDHAVMAYIDRLERNDVDFRQESVNLKRITEI